MNKVAKVIAKRVANAALCTGLFAVGVHMMPMEMTMVAPEDSGSAAETQEAKSFDKAMKRCKTLPEGTIPGAVVIDYIKAEPVYTTAHVDVDAGFQYAVANYMKADKIPGDRKIEGVTLCK